MAFFATFVVERTAVAQRKAQLTQLTQRSEAIAAGVEEMLSRNVETLQALESSNSFLAGDIEGFAREAQAFLNSQSQADLVSMVDESRHILLNTKAPSLPRYPAPGETASAAEAIRTGTPTVSNLFRGAVSGALVVAVNVPITRGPLKGHAVLRLLSNTDALIAELKGQRLPPGWIAAIIDKSGTMIARNIAPEVFIGQPASPDLLQAIARNPNGVNTGVASDGTKVEAAYRTIPFGWTIAVAVPQEQLNAPIRRSVFLIGAGGVVILGLSTATALLLARRLATKVRLVASSAASMGERRALPRASTGVRELDAVLAAQRRALRVIEHRETELEVANRSLLTAKEEVDRADQAKNRFLASASHDLRQPVQSLFLIHDILKQHRNKPSDDILSTMQKALEGLDTVLSGLLEISRLHAGTVHPNISCFPVATVLDHVEREYHDRLASRGVRLKLVPCGAWVQSDLSLLEQVVHNLVDNAAKYTHSGTVLIGCRNLGRNLAVQVIDTGPGIPAEALDEIWLEFVQLGNPERDRKKGLGLGLPIARHLCELLGHPIRARSVLGRGTCFAVSVPKVAPPASPPPPPPVAVAKKPFRVLLLDDEVMVLEALRCILETWGWQALTAKSAQEATELLSRERQPDAVVVDYRLHDGTGRDALEKIFATLGRPIPALILTGDTSPERVTECEGSGLKILHKPVDAAILKAALVDACETAPAQAEL